MQLTCDPVPLPTLILLNEAGGLRRVWMRRNIVPCGGRIGACPSTFSEERKGYESMRRGRVKRELHIGALPLESLDPRNSHLAS
jgi:hypothetical protein